MSTGPTLTTNLTTNFGQPVTDHQNAQTAGPRGPVVMQDIHLIEKLSAKLFES